MEEKYSKQKVTAAAMSICRCTVGDYGKNDYISKNIFCKNCRPMFWETNDFLAEAIQFIVFYKK